jgi:hypothetical protein
MTVQASASRGDVLRTMNALKPTVQGCARDGHGVAIAKVKVSGPSGRVMSATVEGQNGTVGSCIARTVRRARFPKFRTRVFRFTFPFKL